MLSGWRIFFLFALWWPILDDHRLPFVSAIVLLAIILVLLIIILLLFLMALLILLIL
jgi:hypothetical protein